MCKLVSAAIESRFAEYDILRVHLELLRGIFDAGKPYYVRYPRSVGEVGHEALLARSAAKLLETENPSLHLHEGHVAAQFVDGVYAAAVHVFVWVILQKVGYLRDTQLLLQHVPLLRSHARQILYVLVQYVKHL